MNPEYTFEDAIHRLEELTVMLSSDTVSLADSVGLFKEASELIQYCKTLLENTGLQIEDATKEIENADE